MTASVELWKPSCQQVENAAITRFARNASEKYGAKLTPYENLHEWSVRSPEQFWAEVAQFSDMQFSAPWSKVLERGATLREARWFKDSRLNFAQNLLKHSETDRKHKTAIIFYAESGERQELTFHELRSQVAVVARQLKSWNVRHGDVVAGYLPNQPETVVAMLAATSLGAIWTACSPDFGIEATCDRLMQTQPKVLFATPGYRYNGKTIDVRSKVQTIVKRVASIRQLMWIPYPAQELPVDGGHQWNSTSEPSGSAELEFAQTDFNHPVFIVYSSGTTGKPKCIVHGTGGTLIQHHKEHLLHTGLSAEDKLFYFTTCGWMMWQWLVSALAIGAAIVLYDGSPVFPGPGRLWSMAEKEGITVFGASARYIAGLQKANYRPREHKNLPHLRSLLSTGSPLLAEQFRFAYKHIKPDLCLSSISGGTDIISCFVLGNPALPVNAGQIQCVGLGMDVAFLDQKGVAVTDQKGELACRRPFPSMPVKFWNDPDGERYRSSYFSQSEDVWIHGDYGTLLSNGGVIIHGRSDAVLNPGGVRIGTAEIYAQLDKLDEITDSVVVEQELKGDRRIVLFVVLRDGFRLTDELRDKFRVQLRVNASPRHVPARIERVSAVPRTLNGKLAELAVRETIHNRPVEGLESLANPGCLEEYRKFA